MANVNEFNDDNAALDNLPCRRWVTTRWTTSYTKHAIKNTLAMIVNMM